ncbi:hypothetical protein [Ponticaulis sp.]|uniref:hypothetical protein n=1 Tax=Ponticaulis sp. TaxID=2020902 RepID=UPI000B67F38C|nr:hypothetical protein [Ponticaulis sp.]MAI90005.1 ornithine cyclodeaminase family protein [Ponticaulis sp.]OUX99666.1 MAG: hypothetical protein CBB65_06150 [Hyphomonadaceae bacterium TMED5]|tara:strand:- start:1203 stop:2189 length:987 start_codon:yes stop_codon:yes gene_type:complete
MQGTISFNESELRESVGVGIKELEAIEHAFASTAAEDFTHPPILNLPVGANGGRLEVKSGFVADLPHVALKILMGFPTNVDLGMPVWNAMMVMCSAQTGACTGIMMDNSYLTDIRTGLAGAVAAKYLAPEGTQTAGIIGTGTQARLQLHALRLVRHIDRIVVWGRSPEKMEAYAKEMTEATGLPVIKAGSIEEVMKESQTVITATPSTEALIDNAWVQPGQHITAMGSDLVGMQELDPAILGRADIVVCDSREQCAEIGELQHGIASGDLKDLSLVSELGEVCIGKRPGRKTADQITVCDLTGIGVQDTAIANIAYVEATKRGFGKTL